MKQLNKLALLSIALSGGIFACKAKNNSELSSYEFRDGDRWIVVGMKPGDANVSFRECSQAEIIKIGNRNLSLDSCPRPKKDGTHVYEDMPFAAYRLIFSEQFKIDAGEMKRWQDDKKLAKFYYDGYVTNKASAKTAQEVADFERLATEQKAIMDTADRYMEAHNLREAYVEKVMKFVLPTPEESDSASFETHKLITSGDTGINSDVQLIDELTYPFQKWVKSVLNPETKARLDVLRKNNKNDYTSEFLDNLATAESTMVGAGKWFPRADAAATSWVKTDWLATNEYCLKSSYAIPSKKQLAAWYVYLKARGTPAGAFPPEGNKDEGFIWVRDDLDFSTGKTQEFKTKSGTGDYFLANIYKVTDSFLGKMSLADNGVIGTAVAFSPSTGKYQSSQMLYNPAAATQKAWQLCGPTDSKVLDHKREQLHSLTMCAYKFTTVVGNTYRYAAKMYFGSNQSEIDAALQKDCREMREKKISKDAANTSCETECHPFLTWVNPPKEPNKR